MKTLNHLLTIIFISILLISCSNDDSNNTNENNQQGELVGTWILQNSMLNGNTVTSQDIVEFTSDNRTVFTYKNSGSNGQDVLEAGDWVKSDNNLTITWDDADPNNSEYRLTILELTETSLKWNTIISGEGTLEESFIKQ